MVTKTDTTQIITQPKLDEHVQPSLKRWFKHFLYISSTHRYFNKQDRMQIANAVQQAEKGHVGEIQVVIEGHIPCSQAYHQNTRLRAQQLFAELWVWDTELNSGVLLYLNLCERKVEIVDRAHFALMQGESDAKVLDGKNFAHQRSLGSCASRRPSPI